MSFDLTILGSTSALPSYGRHHSAQVLKVFNQAFLIDCGEGTQMQLSRYRININKIGHVFISHLHGDHFLGLFGLISSMSLLGRVKPISIFAPRDLREIITIQLKHTQTVLNFDIDFHDVDTTVQSQILELGNMTVETIPLSHRIECCGYLFKEKPKPRKVLFSKEDLNISISKFADLKKGLDVLNKDGQTLLNKNVTGEPKKSRSYAYCSDTKYLPELKSILKGVDLLYHESTFLEDMASRAAQTFHTTAQQAATLAKDSEVKQLVIGHFSSRYRELEPLLEEAKSVFDNTLLAEEGRVIEIPD